MLDAADEAIRTPLRYFIDGEATPHMEKWRYSPASCPRLIETDFASVAPAAL